MTEIVAPSDPQLLKAALLCFCAYVDKPNSPHPSGAAQSNIQYAVQQSLPGFEVVWSAVPTPEANYAFVAASPDSRYFLAIRGSLPFEVDDHTHIDWGVIANWFVEDLNVFSSVPWNYGLYAGKPCVAKGAMIAFTNLLQAVDAMGSGLDIYACLKQQAVQKNRSVYITGHSLGGNMTDTFASYFAYALSSDRLSSANSFLVSFAAPAAGNGDFVSDLDAKYPGQRAYHYAIDNDIVPNFSAFGSMTGILAKLFSPSPQAKEIKITFERLQTSLSAAIDAFALSILVASKCAYSQTAQTIAKNSLNPRYLQNTFEDWFQQAASQHSMSNYIRIFSAGDVTIEENMAALTPFMTKSRSVFTTPAVLRPVEPS